MSQEQQQSSEEATRNTYSQPQTPAASAFTSQLHLRPGVVLQQASANTSMGVPNHINGVSILNSNCEAMNPHQIIMTSLPGTMVKTAIPGTSTNVQTIPGWVSQPTTSYQYATPNANPQSQLSSSAVNKNQGQVSIVSDAPLAQRKSSKSQQKKPMPDNNEFSQDAKAQHNRERNREHARSTRLRKKAYVQQLKEMADGLREIQTTEIRQRRIAVQKMMDIKKARRRQIQTVLEYHATYESDPNKWRAVVEESFWFKQPVTPFRSFRRSEVEKDCRIVRGIDAMICDAASLSVMVARIGFRSARWQQITRRKVADKLSQVSRIHINDVSRETESSLSSESSTDGSNAGSWGGNPKRNRASDEPNRWTNPQCDAAKVISSSESSDPKKNIAFGKETDSSEESKTTEAEASQYAGDYQAQKRHRTNNHGTVIQQPNPPLPGGVVHQVRANNDAVRFEGDRAIPLCDRRAPSYMSSAYGSLFSAECNIECYYAINEDDMEVIDDCLMCPFIFRSKNAVLCGALADCVMPGMLRATFSANNMVQKLEIVFDAMGFMQQLDGANGGDVNAQVIPGSLEMALMHCAYEARVITEARPPYSIVHVNEAWTKLTKYSLMEVEGQSLLPLIEGDETDPNAGLQEGRPIHRLESVAQGRAACSTNVHYDKHGNSFIDFMSSYPLTNASDEISHILHISYELPKIAPILS